MNTRQKDIVTKLIQGFDIAHLGPSGIRLRDKVKSPVLKLTKGFFWNLRGVLKKNNKGLWIISPAKVLKLHSNNWIKKEYKKSKGQNIS